MTERTVPALDPAGLLQPEGFTPPHRSVYPALAGLVDAPTTVGDGLLQGLLDRSAPAHAIGCGALAAGRRIGEAEQGCWEFPGIPRSPGPPSASGFTRCSGVPVTQVSSEPTSESTQVRSSRKKKKTKKDRHARHSSASSDGSLASAHRGKRHRAAVSGGFHGRFSDSRGLDFRPA